MRLTRLAPLGLLLVILSGVCNAQGQLAAVIEFYNASLDHYFITHIPSEIAILDAGAQIKGWARTGQSFNAFPVAGVSTSPVCRFYIPPGKGDSHFYGRGTTECNDTATKNPSFINEDPQFFHVALPTQGSCPVGMINVYRVFSNRADANHRYMIDRALRDQMVSERHWLAEGDGADLVVMCAPGTPKISIEISAIAPPTAGDFLQLNAVVRDGSGNVVAAPSIKWSSSNSSVASVTDGGLLLALRPGAVSIAATIDAQTASLLTTVLSRAVPPGEVRMLLGPEEVVFDTVKNGCDPIDGPDLPAHATRRADGSLMLFAVQGPRNYAMTGPTFAALVRNCHPVLVSDENPVASSFRGRAWIAAPYRIGNIIHALLHNEFYDQTNPLCNAGPASFNPCWYNAVTYAASIDDGATFVLPPYPKHLVAPPARRWDPLDPIARSQPYGNFSPSNIIRRLDGYYYTLYFTIPDPHLPWERGLCIMRTRDLADASTWRAWDGFDYSLSMPDPYTLSQPAPACKIVVEGGTQPSVTYNTYLQQFLLVTALAMGTSGNAECGHFYALSPDLIHWTSFKLFRPALQLFPPCNKPNGTGNAGAEVYSSIIDHVSESINFEESGQTPYIYYTRFTSDTSLAPRQLIRQPIIVLKSP